MIAINKNAAPDGLIALRKKAIEGNLSPKDAYSSLKNPLKSDVRNCLIEEQGRICAYCMCRIPHPNVDPAITPIKIEHVLARNPVSAVNIGQGLDYSNLVAVCHGNEAPRAEGHKHADLTCDAYKGNKEFKGLDPCNAETLESIFYSMNGEIDSYDTDIKYDLTEVLNLNCKTSSIVAERKAVLDSLMLDIGPDDEENILSYCVERLAVFSSET
ncbi:MAG: retron system putative HNH endonuclease, partial [Lentisphaeria bacterium]